MSITVRQMTIDDYEQVREVDISTQKQYLGRKFDELSSEELEEHLVSRRSEFSFNVGTGCCFVAEDNNRIIGFILSYEIPSFIGTLYIRYIGIDPDYQNKGVGSLLYEKLVEKAKDKKIKRIWALIDVDNPRSIKLHEKIGFKMRDKKEAILDLRV
jgi:ribosomal protein S18 acetylase RimI-like enzyme